MDKRVQNEIRKLTFRITNAIKSHAKPRKYDWIVLIVSCFSIVFSASAIFVAVHIPKQIAEQQNKIALFEKRFAVYHELKIIDNFLNGYYDTYLIAINNLPIENLEELSQEQREAIYYKSLWEGEIQLNQYSINDDVGAILKLQSQNIESLSLLFYDITSDEETLCKDFFNAYNAMTQRYVQVSNADYYIHIREFDEAYKRFDLTNILKKMQKQLKI